VRLVLLCGPAFSGKTTLSYALEARGFVRVAIDDIVRSGGLEPGAGVPERVWQDASFAASLLITSALQRGQNVVLDDTLCYRFLRDRYRELGSGPHVSVLLVLLKLSADAVRERVEQNLRLRQRASIDPALLESHLASFEWPGADEPHLELDGTSRIETQLSLLRQAIAPAAAGRMR
jgi:predicted kinase